MNYELLIMNYFIAKLMSESVLIRVNLYPCALGTCALGNRYPRLNKFFVSIRVNSW